MINFICVVMSFHGYEFECVGFETCAVLQKKIEQLFETIQSRTLWSCYVIRDHIDFIICLISSMKSRHKYNGITSNVFLEGKLRVKIDVSKSINQNVLILRYAKLKSV